MQGKQAKIVSPTQERAILGYLGFQEQSPDFLRLAEYHSKCSKC
jgi:hypothetical protein